MLRSKSNTFYGLGKGPAHAPRAVTYVEGIDMTTGRVATVLHIQQISARRDVYAGLIHFNWEEA